METPLRITIRLFTILAFASAAHAETPPRAPDEGIYFNYAADALVGGTIDKNWNWHLLGDGAVDLETATAEQLRKTYRAAMDYYADSNVTCMLLNMNYNRAAFDSKVWASYGSDDPELKHLDAWPRNNALIRRKIDHYAVCVERCREVGMSPWASFRMNDHHYHDKPYRSSVFLRENPACRMGNRFDYNHPKVRRHFLALIEEVLRRYDLGGIELDWRRTAPPAPLNDLERATRSLDAFMCDVRKIADSAAEKHGHPVFVAVRVLETPEFSQRSALDAASWAREGLADVIIPSPFFGTMTTDLPMQQWREAIGETDHPYVLVAGTDHYIRAYPGAKEIRLTAAINRGFTTAMLHRGADAVYLFNQWNRANMQYTPVSPGLKRGDPRLVMVKDEHRDALTTTGRMETALSLPRRHIVSYREGPARGAANPRQLPRKLNANKPESFVLATGPARKLGKVTLRIGVEKLKADAADQLTAEVNANRCRPIPDFPRDKPLATMTIPGQPNDLTRVAPRVVQFDVSTDALQDGDNHITLQSAATNQPRIVWVEILIEPASEKKG